MSYSFIFACLDAWPWEASHRPRITYIQFSQHVARVPERKAAVYSNSNACRARASAAPQTDKRLASANKASGRNISVFPMRALGKYKHPSFSNARIGFNNINIADFLMRALG